MKIKNGKIMAGQKIISALRPQNIGWILAVVWTAVVLVALVLNLIQIRQHTFNVARIQAQVAYEKDVIYRTWLADLGGVYVPLSGVSEPNQYLSDRPERDLETIGGLQLTLMNPAWMTRQVHELSLEQHGVRGHITSLNPIRPENSPDSWETAALKAFERGIEETSSVEIIAGAEYLRFMEPLITEQECLKCHAKQGYQEGDIRGGISVSVPMKPLVTLAGKRANVLALVHLSFWSLGIGGIFWSRRRLMQRESERRFALEALQKVKDELETQVEKRTSELQAANVRLEEDITERRRAEEALRKLTRAVEQSPGIVLITDVAGNIDYVNPMFVETTGYSFKEVQGKNPRLLKSGETPPEEYKKLWDTITAGKTWRGQFQNKKKSGEIYWEDAVIGPIKDRQGEITHFLAIKEDITQRKQAEEALRVSEASLREAQQIAHIGNWKLDLITNSLYWSDEIYRIFDLEPQQFTATYDAFLYNIHPDDREYVDKTYTDSLKNKTPYSIVHRLQLEDGTVKYVREQCKTDFNEDGQPIRSIGTVQDITEQKQAEEALEESERKLRSFHENALEGIFRTTPAGKILYANAAMARIFGYGSSDELLAKTAADLYLTPHQWKEISRLYEEVGHIQNLELEMQHKEGTPIWVRLSATAAKDKNGKIVWCEGFISDITERKQLESELLKIQKLESIGVLAGGIAHDFNNFLTEIQLNATTGKLTAQALPDIQRRFIAIEKSVSKATGITRQLLTFSRGGDPVKTKTEFGSPLKESIKFALHGTSVVPEFNIPGDLWIVKIDVSQINQVLSNLVLNARQAMSEGGTLKVSVANTIVSDLSPMGPLKHGRYLQVSIEDEGHGIDSGIIDKIFDPYFSTKSDGHGLGLFSCFSIIEKHKGWITAKSEVGVGSTFTFYLPALDDGLPIKTSPQKELVAGTGRILIMDDEEGIRNALTELLASLGYESDATADGDAAVSLYADNLRLGKHYDAVILDLTVPNGRGGIETVNEIKRLDPTVKAIVSSGYATGPIMANYSDYGFDDVLIKPYTMEDLSETIRQTLHSS